MQVNRILTGRSTVFNHDELLGTHFTAGKLGLHHNPLQFYLVLEVLEIYIHPPLPIQNEIAQFKSSSFSTLLLEIF